MSGKVELLYRIIAKYKTIAISNVKIIAKSQKYFKKYCKISKVLQKLLQKVLFYFAQQKIVKAVIFFTKF